MTTSRSTETFVSGDERVRRLRERADLADQLESARAEMRDADRAHAMGLSAIRRAADLTQTELARQLGVSQAAVAKTEQRHDLLLSTLRAYLEAIGGHVRIVVTFQGGGEVELDLSQLGSTPSGAQPATA
jgi:DNA-binding transcriptional regulator YiaG